MFILCVLYVYAIIINKICVCKKYLIAIFINLILVGIRVNRKLNDLSFLYFLLNYICIYLYIHTYIVITLDHLNIYRNND